MSALGGTTRVPVNANDHEAFIIITAVLGMTWTLLVLCIRIYIRHYLNGPFGLDDGAAIFGSAIGIIQSSLTLVAVSHGIGMNTDYLTKADTILAFKFLYAASILYVLAICSAKCSMSLLLSRLTRTRAHLIAGYTLTGLIALWGIAGMITAALKCSLPDPWDIGIAKDCHYMFVRWASVESISMAIEVVISFGAITIVWSLHMPLRLKVIVWGAFSLQLFTIVPTIVRLLFIHGVTSLSFSRDPTLSSTPTVIATQVVMHFSLMSATFPCMKQFLQAFNSNLSATTKMDTSIYGSGPGSSNGPDSSHYPGSISSRGILGSSKTDNEPPTFPCPELTTDSYPKSGHPSHHKPNNIFKATPPTNLPNKRVRNLNRKPTLPTATLFRTDAQETITSVTSATSTLEKMIKGMNRSRERDGGEIRRSIGSDDEEMGESDEGVIKKTRGFDVSFERC